MACGYKFIVDASKLIPREVVLYGQILAIFDTQLLFYCADLCYFFILGLIEGFFE